MQALSNGPEWLNWVIFVLLVILSAVFLSGHGANLIAGYNTSSRDEKAKYDEKKLCRVGGVGILIIAVLLPFATFMQALLPAWIVYVYLGIVFLDSLTMIILANTICRKKDEEE